MLRNDMIHKGGILGVLDVLYNMESLASILMASWFFI